uniref:hypothetical protein n=1 Tax=Thaumasiovibrio occultus TaxID=1891184 RepID=UPI000B35F4D1|nr:hypothetical protein [Thaumasiovibrio occultus]
MDKKTNVLRRQLNKFDHRDLINSSFWVGQIFVLIATIIGVYLAAQGGLRQAIEFDNLAGDQNVYFLQKSLHSEVSGNIGLIRKFTADLREGNGTFDRDTVPEFYDLVWSNMRYSNYTLETPPQYLIPIQQFYAEANMVIKKYRDHYIGTQKTVRHLEALVAEIEPILQSMDDDLVSMHQELMEAGMKL